MLTKLVPIGNSQGIRLPKKIIDKYRLDRPLCIEEKEDGILIYPARDNKLSWAATFREKASEAEDWSDFETVIDDGLEEWVSEEWK